MDLPVQWKSVISVPPLSCAPTFPSITSYKAVLNDICATPLSEKLIHRLENLTHQPVPTIIRRGLVMETGLFELLQSSGEPFYVVVSRSASASHIGHLPALKIAQYLQSAFHCPVIIQITDDKSYVQEDASTTLKDVNPPAFSAVREAIVAVDPPFDPKLTFLFSNLMFLHSFVPVFWRILRATNNIQAKTLFGTQLSDNLGLSAFVGSSVAPVFYEAFPSVLGNTYRPCVRVGGVELGAHIKVARQVPNEGDVPACGSRLFTGLFTQHVPSLNESREAMHCSNGAMFLYDSYEILQTKLSKCDPGTLLQLLWWFLESDEELDYVQLEELDDIKHVKLRAHVLRVVWGVVKPWQQRLVQLKDKDVRTMATDRRIVS